MEYTITMKESGSTEESLRVVERFETLPVESRLDVFKKLSAEAREELIGVLSNPGEIVRRISEEEMFFTIKQLGEAHAPSLLRATSGRQLRYILDVDLWRKDMFDPRAAHRWMKAIAGLSGDKVLQLVQVTDRELLAVAMDSVIRVQVTDPERDLLEQMDLLPQFTLDNLFFVDFRFPDMEDTAKAFLETIFEWSPEFYFGLMEELARGIPAENEEMALKWRRARLADHGFPEFDEALDIYHYLPQSMLSLTEPAPPVYDADEPIGGRAITEYPLKTIDAESLFMQGLKRIDDPAHKDRLSVELAHLANKVIIADGREPGSVDEIQRALRKVGGHINIAIEESCGYDLSEATELLESNHMEILFRRGFSLILELRKEAQRLIRSHEGGVENLGHPLAELLKALIQKRPFYAAHVIGERENREFESLDDLKTIRDHMNKAYSEENWEPI